MDTSPNTVPIQFRYSFRFSSIPETTQTGYQKCVANSLKPRSYRSNPWHLVGFKDFISYLVKQARFDVNFHFSPISTAIQSSIPSKTVRNTCHFNYTAIIKLEHMKSELNFILEQNNIQIPSGEFFNYFFKFLWQKMFRVWRYFA